MEPPLLGLKERDSRSWFHTLCFLLKPLFLLSICHSQLNWHLISSLRKGKKLVSSSTTNIFTTKSTKVHLSVFLPITLGKQCTYLQAALLLVLKNTAYGRSVLYLTCIIRRFVSAGLSSSKKMEDGPVISPPALAWLPYHLYTIALELIVYFCCLHFLFLTDFCQAFDPMNHPLIDSPMTSLLQIQVSS
jgi:hypothetical protein